MKTVIKIVSIALFFTLFSVKTNAQEWEYLTLGFIDAVYEESLEIAGQNGWELVSSRRVMVGEGEWRMAATEAIFKRQKTTNISKFKTVDQLKNVIEELQNNHLKIMIAERLAEKERLDEEKIKEETRKLEEAKARTAKREKRT